MPSTVVVVGGNRLLLANINKMSKRKRRSSFCLLADVRIILAAKVADKMRGLLQRGITRKKTAGSRHLHRRHLSLVVLSRMQVMGQLQYRRKHRNKMIEQKCAVRLILKGEASKVLDPPDFKHKVLRPMPPRMTMQVLKQADCHAAYKAAPRWAKSIVLKELSDSHNCSWSFMFGKALSDD